MLQRGALLIRETADAAAVLARLGSRAARLTLSGAVARAAHRGGRKGVAGGAAALEWLSRRQPGKRASTLAPILQSVEPPPPRGCAAAPYSARPAQGQPHGPIAFYSQAPPLH